MSSKNRIIEEHYTRTEYMLEEIRRLTAAMFAPTAIAIDVDILIVRIAVFRAAATEFYRALTAARLTEAERARANQILVEMECALTGDMLGCAMPIHTEGDMQ